MKKKRVIGLMVLFCILSAGSLSALTLKVGSLAPSDSPWDTALKRLAILWKDISGGRVTMKIYPGGIAGDEADMVRKVRIGQLDGAALTGTGLNRITSELLVLSLPMFYTSYGELRYIFENTTEEFSGIVREKGFELITWTTAGWAHFFGKRPVLTPDDLRAQRIAVSAEDEEILYTWRAMGFDALPLHTTGLMAGLQSGMAEAFHTPPLIAAIYQWFGLAPYMSSMAMAPLITGIVIGERSWRRIPDQFKEEFLEAAQTITLPLYDEVEKLEIEAIQIMKDNGLTINHQTEEDIASWQDVIKQGHDILVGTSISPEVYEKVKALRDEYRRTHE
ncbi:MAG: ABC transporter substrate-binding protein [Spirochaetales bacterium]|nr:ABC transporter substrate-binding protein [Spirochaetales bacterium]